MLCKTLCNKTQASVRRTERTNQNARRVAQRI